jgi:hypothetical protein
MRLPNSHRAVADIRKLRDYCLNPSSPRGRTKARAFKSMLGLEQDGAEELRQALLGAARNSDCEAGEKDEFGQRYTLDFLFEVGRAKAWVRSGWFVRTGETFPRLTTCYVLMRRSL